MEESKQENLIYKIADGKVMIIGCNDKTIRELVIPQIIDGFPVVSIELH